MKYSVKSPQKGALTHFLSTFASMKTLTDTEYIHALIAEGEHQQQDFKFEISDARKIAKTLSAFANTDGGKLLIGVKDNGKIAGVRSDEEQYIKLWQMPQPPTVFPSMPALPERTVPLEEQETSYFADSASIFSLLRTFSSIIPASKVAIILFKNKKDRQ